MSVVDSESTDENEEGSDDENDETETDEENTATTSPGTTRVADHVYLVPNVLSHGIARSLLFKLRKLECFPIHNPDELRGQTQTYETYDLTGKRRTRGLVYERFIHDVVKCVISKLDTNIVGGADTAVAARGIDAKKGCKSQEHHPDFLKNPTNYWSVIVAVQHGSRLEICLGRDKEPLIVDIPLGSALLFRGDVVHGGASYDHNNIRFFFKLVPYIDARLISLRSTEKNERLAVGQYCDHNKPLGAVVF